VTGTIRVNAYIDGFNLYYRAIREHPNCRWLDIPALCETMCGMMLPGQNCTLGSIFYFTARVRATESNPNKAHNQDVFLRALKHLGVKVIEGRFMRNKIWMPLANGPGYAKVQKTEEKGSDVNLAVAMVRDAANGAFDAALLISKDGDFVGAIDCVQKDFGKRVYVALPGDQKRAKGLTSAATGSLPLWPATLRKHQLPDRIPGTKIHKPATW